MIISIKQKKQGDISTQPIDIIIKTKHDEYMIADLIGEVFVPIWIALGYHPRSIRDALIEVGEQDFTYIPAEEEEE